MIALIEHMTGKPLHQAEIHWEELDEDAAAKACRELLVGMGDAEDDDDETTLQYPSPSLSLCRSVSLTLSLSLALSFAVVAASHRLNFNGFRYIRGATGAGGR